MHKKHLKFVLITEAFAELKNTLDMQSELKKREEIEPLLRRIEDLQIRKGTRKVYPLELVRKNGLWIKSHGSDKTCSGGEQGIWPCVSRKNASQHIACRDCGIAAEVLSAQRK